MGVADLRENPMALCTENLQKLPDFGVWVSEQGLKLDLVYLAHWMRMNNLVSETEISYSVHLKNYLGLSFYLRSPSCTFHLDCSGLFFGTLAARSKTSCAESSEHQNSLLRTENYCHQMLSNTFHFPLDCTLCSLQMRGLREWRYTWISALYCLLHPHLSSSHSR